MDIQNFIAEFKRTFIYDMLCESLEDEQIFEHSIVGDKVIWFKVQTSQMWSMWQAAQAQAVEGFVLVPINKVKYFSHDGENYEVHNTLAEAKHEAECAIEIFSERLADQLCDPRLDGNFQNIGYGIVLAESDYSIDHIVTNEDVENGEYGHEAGTEIMSLFLVEAPEPAND